METLLELAQKLVAELRTQLAAATSERGKLREAELAVQGREDKVAIETAKLEERSRTVAGIEYSQALVAQNEALIRENQKAKEELTQAQEKLAQNRAAFAKEKRAALDAIETEREVQRKNTVAVQKRDAELKAKIAEYQARLKSIGG